MNDKITRVVRYLLRLARILKEETDKRDYQMGLIYSILEIQNAEIKELQRIIGAERILRGRRVASDTIPCDDPKTWTSGCPRPQQEQTIWGTLAG